MQAVSGRSKTLFETLSHQWIVGLKYEKAAIRRRWRTRQPIKASAFRPNQ
jgi:hypothetical protein